MGTLGGPGTAALLQMDSVGMPFCPPFTTLQLHLGVKITVTGRRQGHQGRLPGRKNTHEKGEMRIPGGEVSLYRATEWSGDYNCSAVE